MLLYFVHPRSAVPAGVDACCRRSLAGCREQEPHERWSKVPQYASSPSSKCNTRALIVSCARRRWLRSSSLRGPCCDLDALLGLLGLSHVDRLCWSCDRRRTAGGGTGAIAHRLYSLTSSSSSRSRSSSKSPNLSCRCACTLAANSLGSRVASFAGADAWPVAAWAAPPLLRGAVQSRAL